MSTLGVGIIGCGLIGRKRAAALGPATLRACADVQMDRARALARDFGCAACNDSEQLLARNDLDLIIVCTTNDMLAPLSVRALETGRHVLVEKPAARNGHELDTVRKALEKHPGLLRVGFNHRYHPALVKAFEIQRSGILGPLMFVRALYGHGARVGYDQEWRMVPAISGGGELIDQGVHVIDLARRFLGDFTEIHGRAETQFWNTPADDNAFMILKTARRQTAFMHVSCTEWKNLFSFEVYGKHGKLHVTGLGGSYGIERLAHYQMREEMGPPETTIWEYPQTDTSWAIEFQEFIEDIRLGRQPAAGLEDAQAAMRVVEALYQQSGK